MIAFRMPIWHTESLLQSVVGFVRGLRQDTHQQSLVAKRERERERDGAVASTCGIESWEYWLATGATAALPIWTGMRHVVEKIYLFGGLYCKILFGLM